MPDALVVRKEVIVKEDGRQVILFTFVPASEAGKSTQAESAQA